MSVFVAGVGMTSFVTPRHTEPYDVMAQAAIRAALADAGIEFSAVQQAFASYVYGDSTAGQRAVYGVGTTGIPVVNVNNNCSSGSSALFLARQAIEAGDADCVLAVGFEQMRRGSLSSHWEDRPDPLGRFLEVAERVQGPLGDVPVAAFYFGGAGRAYADEFGTPPETFAAVTVKARRHAAANPHAVFTEQVTVEQVLDSGHVYAMLTRLQCCPPTCGAAAVVLVSDAWRRRNPGVARVALRAQAMTSDTDASFDPPDLQRLVGYDMTASAAARVYERSGVDPLDIPVVELHDCFTANEVISYEAIGLTPRGTAEKFIADGDNTYGGRVVTNPSGGLLSKGHPLGATGLAQCAELTWQLRGQAGGRQVEGARLALQHNIGLGGAAVVTLYEAVG